MSLGRRGDPTVDLRTPGGSPIEDRRRRHGRIVTEDHERTRETLEINESGSGGSLGGSERMPLARISGALVSGAGDGVRQTESVEQEPSCFGSRVEIGRAGMGNLDLR
jgi:hypothetical protein